MFKDIRVNLFKKVGVVATGLTVGASAFAAAPDTTAVVASITDGSTAAAVVGLAMLAAIAAIKGLKLIRRAL